MSHFFKVPPSLETPWQEFDPVIRDVARRLYEAWFTALAPDFRWLDAVNVECEPENLIAETRRLYDLVESWQTPDYDFERDGYGVVGVYDPNEPSAHIEVRGVAMILRSPGD